MRRDEAAGAGVGLESSGDQPVDGFLVDPHDLVDLDLLSGHVDRCLAKAWHIHAIRDRLTIEYELGDRKVVADRAAKTADMLIRGLMR